MSGGDKDHLLGLVMSMLVLAGIFFFIVNVCGRG